MRKPWSISTTVRNAERIRNFLLALKEIEGQDWNNDNQIKYQVILIQRRYYGLTTQFFNGLSDVQIRLLQSADQMSYSEALEIFNTKNYQDPPMRGRQSFNPLRKFGLVKIIEGKIEITSLGRYLLQEDSDLGEMFFRSFIKWQLPNLDDDDFKEEDGFAIKPFVATLHFIKSVNNKWIQKGHSAKGISKDEFCLFIPTLIDYRQIDSQAEKVILLRESFIGKTQAEQKNIFKKFRLQFVKEFLRTTNTDEINSSLDNLTDYGDSAIRYFRLTRYFYIRGGGFYIDLEPRRTVEIQALLEQDNAAPIAFANIDAYRDYVSDISRPVLPWESLTALRVIATNSLNDINILRNELNIRSIVVPAFSLLDPTNLALEDLKQYIEDIRKHRRDLQDIIVHFTAQGILKLEEYINALKNIHGSEAKKSIELERLAVLALNALNDAIAIKPNYPVGDDNEPIFTAPGNKPDIECFYENFNAVCEVTMLTDRTQWYNEGQPVMRHVRDFEVKYNDKKAYCIFISPRLHVDTAETFWMSIKHGYKGIQQKIVPISITQLVKILEVLLRGKKENKVFRHNDLSKLFDQIVGLTETMDNSDRWLQEIPGSISSWETELFQVAS